MKGLYIEIWYETMDASSLAINLFKGDTERGNIRLYIHKCTINNSLQTNLCQPSETITDKFLWSPDEALKEHSTMLC